MQLLVSTPHPTWSPRERELKASGLASHTHLLPLHSRPARVTAVLRQCKRLLHEAREGCIQVAAMQAHSGGCSPLNGTAAPFPGISAAAVSVDSLIPERQGHAQRGMTGKEPCTSPRCFHDIPTLMLRVGPKAELRNQALSTGEVPLSLSWLCGLPPWPADMSLSSVACLPADMRGQLHVLSLTTAGH